MTGGVSTFVRCFASVSADTPIADRWDALGEAIDQHGRDIKRAQSELRTGMAARETERQAIIARFGLTGLVGPANPTMKD